MPLKYFLLSLVSTFFLKCGGDYENAVRLRLSPKKKTFRWGDTISINLQNKKGIALNNVDYFLNETPISKDHVLTNEPLGKYTLKVTFEHEKGSSSLEKKVLIVADEPPVLYSYRILNKYPHDIEAYTQGLEFDGDRLLESTGLKTKSSLRRVNFKSGTIEAQVKLDDSYFGEGLTLLNGKIYQLTWKSNMGFIYDASNLKLLTSFPYQDSKEGWGLCNDGQWIYKSDGSNKIWKLHPETGKESGFIEAMTHKTSLNKLNELEWVNGKIYANTYQSEKEVVVIINPESGKVEGVINFSGLKVKVKQHPKLNVLNGIAYHPKRKTLFVTGKNWDTIFEVEIFKK